MTFFLQQDLGFSEHAQQQDVTYEYDEDLEVVMLCPKSSASAGNLTRVWLSDVYVPLCWETYFTSKRKAEFT